MLTLEELETAFMLRGFAELAASRDAEGRPSNETGRVSVCDDTAGMLGARIAIETWAIEALVRSPQQPERGARADLCGGWTEYRDRVGVEYVKRFDVGCTPAGDQVGVIYWPRAAHATLWVTFGAHTIRISTDDDAVYRGAHGTERLTPVQLEKKCGAWAGGTQAQHTSSSFFFKFFDVFYSFFLFLRASAASV